MPRPRRARNPHGSRSRLTQLPPPARHRPPPSQSAAFSKMKVAELTALCEKNGLDTDGQKVRCAPTPLPRMKAILSLGLPNPPTHEPVQKNFIDRLLAKGVNPPGAGGEGGDDGDDAGSNASASSGSSTSASSSSASATAAATPAPPPPPAPTIAETSASAAAAAAAAASSALGLGLLPPPAPPTAPMPALHPSHPPPPAMPMEAGAEKKDGQKRKRVAWTKVEEAALRRGYTKYKESATKWADILKDDSLVVSRVGGGGATNSHAASYLCVPRRLALARAI